MATFIGICIVALFIKLAICSIIAIIGAVFYLFELLFIVAINTFTKKELKYFSEYNHIISCAFFDLKDEIMDI